MEYVILGLLALQPRTIYELRKRIDEGLSLMYSCSTGSIQAAIKKLLRGGYIDVREVEENGRVKKVYALTKAGKARFELWINGTFDGGCPKNPDLTKVYFMGFAGKEKRVKAIESHVSDLRKTLSALEKICEEGERLLSREKENEILFFQLQTARYGRDFMRFNIEWYGDLAKALGGGEK